MSARIREQAKAWRGWCAMIEAHLAPILHKLDDTNYFVAWKDSRGYPSSPFCPTSDAAIIAAADAALGEGWDKGSA